LKLQGVWQVPAARPEGPKIVALAPITLVRTWTGGVAVGGDGMPAVVGIFGCWERRVVVGNFVNHVDAGRSVAHEVEERRLLRRTEFAGEDEGVAGG